MFSGIAGLLSAYAWDTSAGAAIVLYAAACYFVSLGARRFVK
jgi:ABC-type Mn2+/Zn2+ transport system permease subunit